MLTKARIEDDQKDRNFSWNWAIWPIADYKKPIPEFAISRAVSIAEKLTESKIPFDFVVEELTKRWESADPFLVLRVSGVKIYIDVWEEPGFEQRRKV